MCYAVDAKVSNFYAATIGSDCDSVRSVRESQINSSPLWNNKEKTPMEATIRQLRQENQVLEDTVAKLKAQLDEKSQSNHEPRRFLWF